MKGSADYLAPSRKRFELKAIWKSRQRSPLVARFCHLKVEHVTTTRAGGNKMRAHWLVIGIVLASAGCTGTTTETPVPTGSERLTQLPTGARLDPAGKSFDVGSLPLAITLSPDGKSVVVLLN